MTELRVIADLAEIMDWRREVIGCVFGVEPTEALMDANSDYYRRHMADGTHTVWVASCDGSDAGVGAVCYSEELPSPDNPTGRCAYLMNIYVRPQWRRRGIAREIVNHLVEEARSRGCGKIFLETTGMARPLYRSCGFTDMENMMKYES